MLEQIFTNIQYGDYQTLGKTLGISAEAAKMRIRRGDEKTANILRKIIENRENLISELSEIAKTA